MALSRGEYMALTRAGLTTPEGVQGAPEEMLTQAVGTQRAAQLASGRSGFGPQTDATEGLAVSDHADPLYAGA